MNCRVADEITKSNNIANEEFSIYCFNYFFPLKFSNRLKVHIGISIVKTEENKIREQ